MSDKDDIPSSGWSGKLALAGAAIGSAAVAASAVCVAARNARKAKAPTLPETPPETDWNRTRRRGKALHAAPGRV
jgi:hypothetical protein